MGMYDEAKRLNGACALPLLLLWCLGVDAVVDKLLEKEPNNLQARSLGMLIDKKMTRGALYMSLLTYKG